MGSFLKIEGEYALVRKAGIIKHVDVYERNDLIFIAYSGGYVQTYAHGTTSVDKLALIEISLADDRLARTETGKLCWARRKHSKKLTKAQFDYLAGGID